MHRIQFCNDHGLFDSKLAWSRLDRQHYTIRVVEAVGLGYDTCCVVLLRETCHKWFIVRGFFFNIISHSIFPTSNRFLYSFVSRGLFGLERRVELKHYHVIIKFMDSY